MIAAHHTRAAASGLRRAALSAFLFTALTTAPAVADVLPPQIHTVAGGGSCKGLVTTGGPCDNVKATTVPIYKAQSVAAMPDGSFLYSDYYNHVVREVTVDGRVLTVAGNGTTTDAPDRTLAVQSGLNGPISVAPVPSGGFLITEYDGAVVRFVSSLDPTSATITTIAGTGTPGGAGVLGGPGVAATSVPLDYPTDAEPTPDGQVLIADRYNGYIRLVSAAAPGATMSTIGGGGACDDRSAGCDGAAATALALHEPVAVSPAADGSGGYVITEFGEDVVRRVSAVSPFATVTRIAGSPGVAGYAGDGGPAAAALLNHPAQAASRPDGSVAVADSGNQRVRLIAPDGTITTLAGNGVASYAGDGGNATDASLSTPLATSLLPNGNTLIADANNNAIREVTIPPTTIVTLSPGAPNGLNGWYVSTVHIAVTSNEPGKSNCVLDPGQAPPVFDAFPTPCPYAKKGADLSDMGVHTLYVASANTFGDKELPTTVQIKIDTTPPTLACVGSPTFVIGAKHARMNATVTDQLSGPATPMASAPVDTSFLGQYGVTVGGYDNAGNLGRVGCSYTILPKLFNPRPVVQYGFVPNRQPGNGPQTARVSYLRVTNLPRGAVVRVTCAGRGCPFTRRRCPSAGCATRSARHSPVGTLSLAPLFAGARLSAGSRIAVSISRSDTVGRIWQLTVRRDGNAGVAIGCLPPDATRPTKFDRSKC